MGNLDSHRFDVLRTLRLADYITLLNGVCGVLSIISSAHYCLHPTHNDTAIWDALGLIMLGYIFDVYDGRVARWMNETSELGQQLDSLADMITFGISPAILAFAVGFQTPMDLVALIFYTQCGLIRLARFNVTAHKIAKKKSGKVVYYEGLPVPVASLLITYILGFLVHLSWTSDQLPWGQWFLDSSFATHKLSLLFIVLGCMMASKSLRIYTSGYFGPLLPMVFFLIVIGKNLGNIVY